MKKGVFYLIPNYLGENTLFKFDNSFKNKINEINNFIFENEKKGRAFIKKICPLKKQSLIKVSLLNKFTERRNLKKLIEPCFSGIDMALISDAGCPCIADPGADLVMFCHQYNIEVKPLVGPSSILLALMASGLNGQNFEFNGYLPIKNPEKKNSIKAIEKKSINTTQIFMETPYRNNQMIKDLIINLKKDTILCVATNLSLKTEFINTETVENWKKKNYDFNKKPSIFLIQSKS